MAVIAVKGAIVSNENKWIYDWFGIQAVSPADIERALDKANGEDVVVEINSGGGEVFAGFEIYTLIRQYKGKIENHIVGLAGSAASVIATAVQCKISPVGMIMIHNSTTSTSGDYQEMDKTSQFLQTINSSIRLAYMSKTTITEEELVSLMDEEHWMNAKEAIEKGFADEMLFDESEEEQNPIIMNAGIDTVLNSKIIERMKKMKEDNTLDLANATNSIGSASDISDTTDNHIEISNEGGNKMTYADVVKEHPEIADEVNSMISDAEKRGAEQERSRIQKIDNIAGAIGSSLAMDAKYDNPVTAEQLALKAIQNNKKLGDAYMKDALKDSADSGVDDVTTDPEEDSVNDEKLADIAAEAANRKRRGVK